MSEKYDKLLDNYAPYTRSEYEKLGEELVGELGQIASNCISTKKSKKMRFLTFSGLEKTARKYTQKRKELQSVIDEIMKGDNLHGRIFVLIFRQEMHDGALKRDPTLRRLPETHFGAFRWGRRK